jgi:hypothetical protein
MTDQEVIILSSDLAPPSPRLSCSQPGILTLAAVERTDNAQDHLTAGSLHVTGDLTVAGKVNGRHIMQDGETLDVHVAARNNPHGVTAIQTGALPLAGGAIQGRLGIGVPNPQETLDVNGRIKASQLTVTGDLTVHGKVNGRTIEQDGDTLDAHVAARNNPHGVTATQIGALPLSGGSIQGRLGVGVSSPQETLEVNGRIKSGKLSIGPWPASEERYVCFGANTLDQSKPGNYALVQDTREGGTTFLNSPVEIHFRIANTSKMVLNNEGRLDIKDGQLRLETNGYLSITDQDGIEGVGARISHGAGYLCVLNRKDGGAYVLADENGGKWYIRNSAGKEVVRSYVTPSGAGYLSIYDQNGNPTHRLDGAGVNNFVMSHPRDADKDIIYAAIEGPEAAAYLRGTAQLERGRAEVAFPEHFALVANPDTLTIHVTPHAAQSTGLAVIERSEAGFVVQELGGGRGSYRFDYFVAGVRRGLEGYSPVVAKGMSALGELVEKRVVFGAAESGASAKDLASKDTPLPVDRSKEIAPASPKQPSVG